MRAALVETVTRPRISEHGDGIALILRGVNTNPGAEPEDMVSLRLWVQAERIVSLSIRELEAVRECAAALDAGDGPRNAEAFLCDLVGRINRSNAAYVDLLDDEGDTIEKHVIARPDVTFRARVNDIRGEVVDLRQFLLPQRTVLGRLAASEAPFLSPAGRLRLAEEQESAGRMWEVVESLRDRLVVLKDELAASAAERLNRHLYVIALITVIFTPLSVLTGLLGVNLAGIPGADWPGAFWTFAALVGAIGGAQVLTLRLLRWF